MSRSRQVFRQTRGCLPGPVPTVRRGTHRHHHKASRQPRRITARRTPARRNSPPAAQCVACPSSPGLCRILRHPPRKTAIPLVLFPDPPPFDSGGRGARHQTTKEHPAAVGVACMSRRGATMSGYPFPLSAASVLALSVAAHAA